MMKETAPLPLQSCLAVIPARGGSKRVPGKNIRELCGKPIIAYTVEAALESGVRRIISWGNGTNEASCFRDGW